MTLFANRVTSDVIRQGYTEIEWVPTSLWTGVLIRRWPWEGRSTWRVPCDEKGRDGCYAAARKGMPEVARKLEDRKRKERIPLEVSKKA